MWLSFFWFAVEWQNDDERAKKFCSRVAGTKSGKNMTGENPVKV